MDQFMHLNKSMKRDLVGGFVHIALNKTVKTQLSFDDVLRDHFTTEAVYKLTTPIFILGIVTGMKGDEYNVLVCIDNAAVKKNIHALSTLVTGSHDENGYVLR